MTRRVLRRLLALLTTGIVLASTACSAHPAAGSVALTLWHGYTEQESDALAKLADRWNGEHPDQKVELVFDGGNDTALQKTLASFVAGNPPTVAYEFGSSITPLAARSETADLTDLIKANPDFAWDDFFPAVRDAATVNGHIYGLPALVDNLALVYNKKLFTEAGLSMPTAEWTWDDFRTAAKRLSDRDGTRYGWAYVNDGSEDTVWRYLALLWQAGGDLLTADNTKAAFDSPAGLQAAKLLRDMAVTDKSVFLDQGDQQYLNLFNSGRLGMMWTGPWDLSGINEDVNYGVQILPGKVNHATIAGPDNFMLFDKSAQQRAWPFLQWLLSPEIHLEYATETGHLPLRQSEQTLSGYPAYQQKYPASRLFVDNLSDNVAKTRPNIPQYPEISQVLGSAIQGVLLGQTDPDDALTEAGAAVDKILAGG